MNNILITGATGFIGRYLVEQFYENNNVVCLVRPGTKNLKRIAEFSDKIKIVEHNIRDPYDLSVFKDIDIILHAGANQYHCHVASEYPRSRLQGIPSQGH